MRTKFLFVYSIFLALVIPASVKANGPVEQWKCWYEYDIAKTCWVRCAQLACASVAHPSKCEDGGYGFESKCELLNPTPPTSSVNHWKCVDPVDDSEFHMYSGPCS